MSAKITFRALDLADFSRFAEWLTRPHVAEWWGSPPSVEELTREYAADMRSGVVTPHFAFLDERPIGFIQSYVVTKADPDWWKDETDSGARGIDQFLANESDLGKGIGSAMVAAFVAHLFEDPAVTKVQTDPSPDNPRAIRAYEKAGFERVGVVDTPDGPALLMVQRRVAR